MARTTQHDNEGHMPSSSTPKPGSIEDGCYDLLRSSLRDPDQLTAMLSNYSTSYNVVNVGIVLPVLRYALAADGADDGSAASPAARASASASAMARRLVGTTHGNNEEEDAQDALVASSLLAGMIVGQLIGGLLGDVLGRRNAMLLVMLLQIGGSLGSALFITTDAAGGLTALEQLSVWRFILGIGAGGVYPLAAVMSAENKVERGGTRTEHAGKDEGECPRTEHAHAEEDAPAAAPPGEGVAIQRVPTAARAEPPRRALRRIALTFSTQGLGFLTVPLLAYPLLRGRVDAGAIWRVLLGCGCVPGVGVLYLQRRPRRGRAAGDAEGAPARDDTGGGTAAGSAPSSDETSLELRTRNEDGARDAGAAPPTVQAAISTLFDDTAGPPFANDLALVDHGHLENGNAEGREHAECEDPAGLGTATLPVRRHSRTLWESIRAEPNLGKKFAGTAGTWFLFDVTFYGNTLFEPIVLEAAFGARATATSDGYEVLLTAVRDSLVISLLALPAYFVTVWVIGRRTCACRSLRAASAPARCGAAPCFPCRQTPEFIQMQGFALMALLYAVIGVCWASLAEMQWLLLVLYAGTFFFANYGPNATTFLLPSVTFSEECRSTLNGLSAAAGKIGAVVGASAFAPAVDLWGENVVMLCCASASFLGLILTRVCLGGGRDSPA